MRAQRWDLEHSRYIGVEIPDACSTYRADFDAPVTCPNCGGTVRFGDTYTSRRWHDRMGFGYGVCGKCHELEVLEEGAANGHR